ncbi:Olfactory receptor 10R2 [Manis javanica]|nr:Olfactory receptor 10R2 [Manis javanica]
MEPANETLGERVRQHEGSCRNPIFILITSLKEEMALLGERKGKQRCDSMSSFPTKHVNHYFCDIAPVMQLASAETYVNGLVIFICGVLVLVVPLIFICISYGFIVHTILKIPSAEGKRKAFSTCASHLIVVVVHYGCASSVYLRPSAKYISGEDKLVTVTYTIITPLLNPMVYSLRNKEVQRAIRKMIGKTGLSLKAL